MSIRGLVCWSAVLVWVLTGFGAGAGDYRSPAVVVASPDGGTLYVAEATANRVAVFDVAGEKVSKHIGLDGTPTDLMVSPDGKDLYVTLGGAKGKVLVVDTGAGTVKRTLAAGHTPMAPVLSLDGKTLYVCNRFNNEVAVYDLGGGSVGKTVAVPREPVAAVLSQDGKSLFVVNHLAAGAASGNYVAMAISVIDTAKGALVKNIAMPNGSTAGRGIALAPDGKHAYVTHILARYQLPTTQLERGWMNTNALSIVDVAGRSLVNTVLLDDVDMGAANPWGVDCTADGKYICVAHAGTHEVSAIEQKALLEKLAKVASGTAVSQASKSADDVPNDLAFLVGIRRRLALAGNGPRGIAMVGTKAYTTEYFTGSLGVVDVNSEVRPKAKSVLLGAAEELDQVRLGESYFHDASFCFQKWQSCTSCHPDSRTDGLNWDLLNDGMGNPKQTKNMLLAHETPPAMITGVREDAETAVRAGLRFIQFAVRPEEDAQAIDAYLQSLTPTESPYLVNGQLSAAARHGKQLFESTGCAECHGGRYYTDLQQYDVKTGSGMEAGMPFDTPALVEVWRTAPYLHDGSAATIEDVLTTRNVEDHHGRTSKLTEKRIKELAEYVNSL
mgnify:CR=1 FL=1